MNLLTTPHDTVTLIKRSRAGVRKADVLSLQKQAQLTNEQLARSLHITVRTWQGYSSDDKLKPTVAERALLLAQLYARGFDFMGTERFRRWMQKDHQALGKKPPMEFLDTYFGIQLLLDELGRIEHGVLA
ncbi:MAG: antitoxin Xre/MbcA/ParS toxin-binding domain-containing protein [Bacteroidota bacterium]